MEEQLLKILSDVKYRETEPYEAQEQVLGLFGVSHSATQIKNLLSVKLMNVARKHVGKKPQDVPDIMELINAIDVIEKHCT